MSGKTLYIFDKDWTLVRPKSSDELFPESPEDQVLMDGVSQKLLALQKEGALFAVASNQGGCIPKNFLAADLRPGMILHSAADRGLGSRILSKITRFTKGKRVQLTVQHIGSSKMAFASFLPDENVQASYKTEADAIAEMQFAIALLRQYEPDGHPEIAGMLCPDQGYRALLVRGQTVREYTTNPATFRKPGGEMLKTLASIYRAEYDIKEILMVGDRADDCAAARIAGVQFEWADDFFLPNGECGTP